METIDLKLDEQNDLVFKVVVEGTGAPASVRMIVEDNDVSYTFSGHASGNDEVSVSLPPLKKKLEEGTYRAKLEVIADERFFTPLEFNARFKQTVKIAEASVSLVNESTPAQTKTVTSSKPRASASIVAAPIVVNKEPVKEAAKKEELPKRRESKKSKINETDLKAIIKLLKNKSQ